MPLPMRLFKKGVKVFFFDQDILREWTIVSPREKTSSYKVNYQSNDWYVYSTDVINSRLFTTETECITAKIEQLKSIVQQWERNIKYHEDCIVNNKAELDKVNTKINILLPYLPATNG